ncbi:LOW QUALITY PROTEIN: F-BAR domain only protein 2-like [Amphiura filiformis]|uniref:LOW QUALITY PROTEIN: F-BAR domain only protein 2-like n=1 Tax=Amphiura filiformis TaxID=82378 RepID=UPI003B228B93
MGRKLRRFMPTLVCLDINRVIEGASFMGINMGEKNQGFPCLYQNMKNGHTSTREIGDFIRERAVIEDAYTKSISKLAKTASNSSTLGTFAPFWQVIKSATEKLAVTHQKLVQKLHEVVKEIQKYGDEQHKKHKTVKSAVQGTADVVTSLQSTHDNLNKLKEAYNNRCIEFERLKKENAGPKELEKAENKYKKAMEDYKNCIEKYGKYRLDFDKKMTDSCQQFQSLEESHLKQLKDFLKQYNVALRECQNSINTVHNEFCQQCDELTEIKLIEMFSESKGTGKEKPGPIEFEECDTSNIPMPDPEKKKKKRKKPKPNKKDKNGSPGDSPDLSPSPSSTLSQQSNNMPSTSMPDVRANTPKVDDEGFTIRPDEETTTNQRDSFYSDSDSESDHDADEKTRKIHVEIKPATNDGSIPNAATVDDIKKSLGNLTLSPPTLRRDKANGDVKRRIQPAMRSSPSCGAALSLKARYKRHTWVGRSTQSSGNLLDLDLTANASGTINLFSPPNDTGSSATTPGSSDSAPVADKYAALRAFSMDDDSSVVSSSTPNTITPTTTPPTSPNTTPTLTNKRWSSPFENNGAAVTILIDTTDLLHSPTTTGDSLPPAIPPKQRHSLGGANTPTSLAGFPPPRPPSRPMSGVQSPVPGHETPPILRQDSSSSLASSSSPFGGSSIAIGTSRGPSPLTLCMSDTIPIAVAFSESVSAYFKGTDQSKCLVKITGDIMFSFPAGIIQALTSNPSPPVLAFQIKNSSRLEQIVPNKQLITSDLDQTSSENQGYYFNMSNLVMLLKNKAGKNVAASYFNVDVLKYQVKAETEGQSTPLHLCSYWKCEPSTTEVRVDYAFNGTAMDQTVPLNNVTLLVPVDGGVTVMQSKPAATWSAESKRALWKIGDVSDAAATGSLRAKFELTEGPSKPSTLAVQFSSEGTTLSGLDIDLLNTSYRLSLVKKRFTSGKYLSES